MRQLFLISTLVALVMYAGFVSKNGTPVASATYPPGVLSPLQGALGATGATLEKVQMTGWVQVKSPDVLAKVKEDLGWNRSGGAGGFREAKLHLKEGTYYLAIQWVLKGPAVLAWHSDYARLDQVLTKVGVHPAITVQLEGLSPRTSPLEMVDRAMAALRAGDRQPWSDAFAASVSGRTTLLPPGPFGVNVQAAVRRDSAGKGARVWVAWPALQQEY